MNRKIRKSLVFSILCLVLVIVIIAVNYALDNTGGKGYSSSMSTLGEYRRSLALIICAITLATASVVMMIISLITFMKRKQAQDEELLRQLEAEAALEEGQSPDEPPKQTE